MNDADNDLKRLSQLSALGERLIEGEYFSLGDYLNFLKHEFSYRHCAKHCAGLRVLDLGCGAGYGSALLAQSAATVTGADMTAEVMEIVARKYPLPNLRFVSLESGELPFANEEFDAVVSLQVIEHVRDGNRFLSEIERVLKPGGKCFIATPNRRIRLLPLQRPWNPQHMREYSYEELERLLRGRFDKVRGFSMQATQEFSHIDRERVRQRPWKVYVEYPLRRLAQVLTPFTRRNSAKPPRVQLSAQEMQRFSIADLRYVPENDPRALDLLFECTASL